MKSKHDIIWLKSVDSTNNEVRRRFSEIDNLSVLSAEIQTAGRGQRGNTWSSKPGENLTFSIVLKFGESDSETFLPPIRAFDQFAISAIAAMSVIDFLSRYDINAKVKWPNDIYVDNRKICGILIENTLRGEIVSGSIVGIGLNVNQTVFDPDLPNPTSLALCRKERDLDVHRIDTKVCIKEFMEIFCSLIHVHLINNDSIDRLRQSYLDKMWLLNESAQFIDTGTETCFTGRIKGLSEVGNLLMELPDKTIREFGFKEISFVLSSKL